MIKAAQEREAEAAAKIRALEAELEACRKPEPARRRGSIFGNRRRLSFSRPAQKPTNWQKAPLATHDAYDPIDDTQLTKVLDVWRLADNTRRKNVTPDGAAAVFSDTFGPVARRGEPRPRPITEQFPCVCKLINQWARSTMLDDFWEWHQLLSG